MPRRVLLTLALAAGLTSVGPTAQAEAPQYRLTVTAGDSGGPDADGTFELRCHLAGGTHRDPSGACARLDELTTPGSDPFAPVPQDAQCTMQYSGPATAHITGTWAGRPVDAAFDRSNGCEIARWNGLVPVLPATSTP
ncbi:hypothetical protein GCM10010245_36430 [Streptomyces spectabilis]|uniref:Subtilisin inhibitor domain-containing protein n=2 Tax=Streptomyces spectabilis TaxID=68270 RepID=A0A5P2XKB8_STRST|nr:SSI family serine proteinase inhibitor [Streptomyces spectabilis]MBB5105441.1 hypothetical protein [Streptomyces spectabilis]QEV63450.1 hypothetical protein CP982_36060 [Streptomyces spectabilis]GGV21632.1 hypothetical protein GCM10010245_36430 [Streptomyces spectabilis]